MGTSGGAAVPRSLLEAFEEKYGLRIIQGWGMTETSPVGGMAYPPAGRRARHGGRARLAAEVRAGHRRRRDAHHRRQRRGAAVGRRRRSARSRSAGRGSPARTTASRRRRSSTTAGCGPVTSAPIDAGLLPDHRPRQGRHQVRRRVDLLGGAGEPARRQPRGGSRPPSSGSRTSNGPSGRWPAWWCATSTTPTRPGWRITSTARWRPGRCRRTGRSSTRYPRRRSASSTRSCSGPGSRPGSCRYGG